MNDPARPPANDLGSAALHEAYGRMVRIRLFEERLVTLLRRGQIHGGAHTCVGQEASVVGALMAVTDEDYMTGTHRSHGHPIGKGSDVRRLMAELMARSTGVCKGHGGSMHLADFSVGSLGESGIVASAMPVAVGAGLSSKLLGNGRVCVCFFGDGASNEGAFHESLNLAAVWNLPVIFLCENNGYAITTAQRDVMKVEHVSTRAIAYGMPGVTVDGQDFFAVHEAVAEAVDRARKGLGPTLVETQTYRFDEHSIGLVLKYRSDEEVARWRDRDPLTLMAARLIDERRSTPDELDRIRGEEAQRIEDAVKFAMESPPCRPEDAFKEVYANPFPVRLDDKFVGGSN